MDEEEQYYEEQEESPSRAQQIAGGIGSLLGGAARGVASTIGGAARGLSSVAQKTTPSLMLTPEGQIVQSTESEDELADLFEVPQPEDNDINCDDLLELDDEDVFGGPEDMSDLLSVSREDIINGNDKPRPKHRLVRTNLPYPPTIIGMR